QVFSAVYRRCHERPRSGDPAATARAERDAADCLFRFAHPLGVPRALRQDRPGVALRRAGSAHRIAALSLARQQGSIARPVRWAGLSGYELPDRLGHRALLAELLA